jgi:hypothetical protein
MVRILKGLTFLLPVMVAAVGVVGVAWVDQTLQNILTKVFYAYAAILAAGVGLLILFILWQLTKAGLYILLGTKTTKDPE